MSDYSQFPPESTDNTPLVYYFPSYFSLQETVTSAKINSLIKCYNTLIEKFMQHNHTEGLNAYDEKTRAVKLAACACLVDGSIFTQCLANGCVTDEKIDTLNYTKVFVNLNTNYFLDDKISDMDTEISLRVHLNNDNTITANNLFTGTNVFNNVTTFNHNVNFNNNVNLNGTTVVTGSLTVPTVATATSDDSAASAKLVDNKITDLMNGILNVSGNVNFLAKVPYSNGNWPTPQAISTSAVKIKIGNTDYYIPALNGDNQTIYVGNCHGSCHGNCHGHCAGMKGVGI